MGQVQSSSNISNTDAKHEEITGQGSSTTQDSEKKGACPMKRPDGNGSFFSWRNPHRSEYLANEATNEAPSIHPSQSSVCPVKRGAAQVQQYNVYSQPIDPSNNMPSLANQLPAPLQTQPLSTLRIPSTIPKGGALEGET